MGEDLKAFPHRQAFYKKFGCIYEIPLFENNNLRGELDGKGL